MPQISVHTGREPLEKTVEFMKLLHEVDISPKWEEFEILDCSKSRARQIDEKMTFEEYIKYPDPSNTLMIDRDEWKWIGDNYEKLKAISFVMRGVRIPKNSEATRFYWWTCHYTDENYKIVEELFRQAYGKDIEDCIFPFKK